MDDAVQEGAAVVAEGRRAVRLNPELMLGAGVLYDTRVEGMGREGKGEGRGKKGREDTSEVTWLLLLRYMDAML